MKAIPELVIVPTDPFGDRAKTPKPPVTTYVFCAATNYGADATPSLSRLDMDAQDRTLAAQKRRFQDHLRNIRSRRRR